MDFFSVSESSEDEMSCQFENDLSDEEDEVFSLVDDSYNGNDDFEDDEQNFMACQVDQESLSELNNKIRSLETPELTALYIHDRKSKFPTRTNIQMRHNAQVEKLKRGERLKANPHKFDRKNKTRMALTVNRTKRPVITQEKSKPKKEKAEVKHISVFEDKSDWNGNLPPFRGIIEIFGEEVIEASKFDIDDDECDTERVYVPEKIVLSNALGSLMSAYNTSDDSDFDDILPKVEPPKVSLPNALSDDEQPTEEKIEKQINIQIPEEKIAVQENIKSSRRRKRSRKNCNENKRARFEDGKSKSKWEDRKIYKKRKITLLERLLEKDIVHERNVILQCVRYIVQNNYFEDLPVEDEQTSVQHVT